MQQIKYMKVIFQTIFILILSIPMILWIIMSFRIHSSSNAPCGNDENCREDRLNERITNIN